MTAIAMRAAQRFAPSWTLPQAASAARGGRHAHRGRAVPRGAGPAAALALHLGLLWGGLGVSVMQDDIPPAVMAVAPALQVQWLAPPGPPPAVAVPQAAPAVRSTVPVQAATALRAPPTSRTAPPSAASPTLVTAAASPVAPAPAEASAEAGALPAPVQSASAAPSLAASAAPSAPAEKPAPVATPAQFHAAYLNNPEPVYPPASRVRGEAGTVQLRVKVGADGQPQAVDVAKSSGFDRLDRAAENTVLRQWRFVPAQRDGQPVAGTVIVPITFHLQ